MSIPTIPHDDRTTLARWVGAMSATGRRQATAVAASRLRQWVNRTLEDRPSRGELRAWIQLVLDERRDLHVRVADAERDLRDARETSAVRGQRVSDMITERALLAEAVKEAEASRDLARKAADQALQEERTARAASTWHAEDAENLRAQRDEAKRERDTLAAALDDARETSVRQLERYEELRVAYEAAESERNEFARVIRNAPDHERHFECEHGVRVVVRVAKSGAE